MAELIPLAASCDQAAAAKDIFLIAALSIMIAMMLSLLAAVTIHTFKGDN